MGAGQAQQEPSPASALPTLHLPKGGGAIRGIGETFSTNPTTGTASFSVPIATSPGRSGFGPQLSLSYDSGAGNGPFGFGWSLSVPQISRKTDKGLPQYRDAEESDVFLLSGAEDLVPVLDKDGDYLDDEATAPGYTVRRYQPRVEGLFARIERWMRRSDGDVHWRSISRDNILTIYGKDSSARISDPADDRRVFTWLISESRDNKGNAILYEHKPEDGAGVDLTRACERNRGERSDARRKVNRYLKRIRYGNRVPLLDGAGRRPRFLADAAIQGAGWMFEVVFDYGEHHPDTPTPSDGGEWACRSDPSSTCRAGFEVRTHRLCRRALMFHHFPGEKAVGDDCLVRSTDLIYSCDQDPGGADNPVYTYLLAVKQASYRREGGGYLKRGLPAVEYEYSRPTVHDAVRQVDAESVENLPGGVDGALYQWVDLHGEGIPGVLTEQAGAWFYKRNQSPLGAGLVELAPLELVAAKPNVAVTGGQAQLMDLAGDGQLDIVVLDGPLPGFYEHDDEEGWQPFRPFASRLHRDMRDPNLRFVDLDGDGHPDVLITELDAFVWHASLGEEGFGPARRVQQALDEERGPRLVFTDGTESIHLADLSGDGLSDLVRIRNGEICYWPNLGYGRFGAKVTMDNAPWFDQPDQFEPRRLRLADIDGSGTTDVLYLHRDGVCLYFNQSGNGWSAPRRLAVSPAAGDLVAVTVADLRGNGTACLVWSSSLPGDARRQMRYVELMGAEKPHLLVRSVNNLGAETHVRYAPSTKFYLQDKLAGKPWLTRLPFPVHVVELVETIDHISGNLFTTRYAYHHGYFDGEEREFRGFGMIEQWDTGALAAQLDGAAPSRATNLDPAFALPAVLTKTWYHTGVYIGRDHVSDYFAGLLDEHDRGEYYREPGLTDDEARRLLLPDTVIPDGLSLTEEREACRALKGAVLRQEVYALDSTEKAPIPYTVVEQSFTLRCPQRRGRNRHGVFFRHAREALQYHYERNPRDPRISHALTLEVDKYGNVLKSLAIGYGRRSSPLVEPRDREKQTTTQITLTASAFTNALDAAAQYPDDHRTPLPAEARAYHLTGFSPENGAARFSFKEWSRDNFALLGSATEIRYEQTASGTAPQKRLIEHVRTLYRRDDLTALLPLGDMQPLGLAGESYKLALTPDLLARVIQRVQPGQPVLSLVPDPGPVLEGKGADQGGYVAMDGGWWIPSGRTFFDPAADVVSPARTAAQELATARAHFYLPRKAADPFDRCTVADYDAHDLLVVRTCDALDNTLAAVNDYRVLQSQEVTDPNGNRTAAAFDALGLVTAVTVMGKQGESLGDVLQGFVSDPSLADLQAFAADPASRAASLLGKATTRIVYDIERYARAGQPPFAATLARETHVHEEKGTPTKIQVGLSYSDGFGREIQKKIPAEPGDAPQRQPLAHLPSGDAVPGDLVRDAQGQPAPARAEPRWVGSGRTVFNNKGKPVKQYEPFFSATHLYEPEREMTEMGVTPVLFYDPLERLIATLHPDHTYDKVVFDPWHQATYDGNDTVAARNRQTGDPRTDPDISGYVRAYFETQPADWKTWRAQRGAGALDAERDAAQKAEAHADTPSVAHLDALGRTFLTVAHNRFERGGAVIEEEVRARVELDIEGNQREVRDAMEQGGDRLGRAVMRYDYDMLGNRIHQASMEAGERWALSDVTGKPIRAWDSRGFIRRMTYDELRRPTGLYVIVRGVERLAEVTVYGEARGDANNHRTRVYQVKDDAGVVTSAGYDFKGNLLESHRRLRVDYRSPPDWSGSPALEGGAPFSSSTRFDALNRPVAATSPDGSVHRPTFNEANLLERLEVSLRRATAPTSFVTDIDYDAKGRRTRIAYRNGAVTTYEYDRETFRLIRLRTTRPAGMNGLASQIFKDPSVVQDLRYTYDPAGNLTRIEDAALEAVFYNGERVEPVGSYTYDALYRLVKACGREHIGQAALDPSPAGGDRRDYPFVANRAHPNDWKALRNYTEFYEYDAVGNFQAMRHVASGGGWTRRYDYLEDSLLEAGKQSNRLTRTTLGNGASHVEDYAHDAHGNITRMPHLAAMEWDFQDRLQRADLGGGGVAYYVYDAAGQRARKVIESRNGARRKERIYLGGFEIYREFKASGADVEVEREALHVVDDKQRIALVETLTVENGVGITSPAPAQRFQLGNHLGSSSVELDEGGSLITYEEYHPYGTTAFQAGRSAAEVSLKRYRYTGKERDEESGLGYHGARYYAPWLGRWTSADPAGLKDGFNTFKYVHGDPIQFIDPQGLATWDTKRGADTNAFRRRHSAAFTNSSIRSQPHHFTMIRDLKQTFPDTSSVSAEALDAIGDDSRMSALASSNRDGYEALVNEKKRTIHNAADLHSVEARDRSLRLHPDATGEERLQHLLRAGEEANATFPDTAKMESRARETWKRVGPEGGEIRLRSNGQVEALFTPQQRAETMERLLSNTRPQSLRGRLAQFVKRAAKGISENPKVARAGAKLAKAGRQIVKALPLVGTGAGLAGAAYAASQGDRVGAMLDTVGLIPVVGDLVDAARSGCALGEAATEFLVDSNLSMRHGDIAKAAMERLGAGEAISNVVGGLAAAASSLGQVMTGSSLGLLFQ